MEQKLNNLLKGSHIHFIGIGGVSMSALAQIVLNMGFIVSGSDFTHSPMLDLLSEKGMDIVIGHSPQNIKSPHLVCYTAAISEDNPELIAARSSAAVVLDRAELLGEIMTYYKNAICISGTHGKTTTTSMVSHILEAANTQPTVTIGGHLIDGGSNLLLGSSDYFVCEACEYTESFLKFNPDYSIILNVDLDHLDYFKDLAHIQRAFTKFGNITKKAVIINVDDPGAQAIISEIRSVDVITYGVEGPASYMAANVKLGVSGVSSFDVMLGGKRIASVEINLPGRHNISNALAAFAQAHCMGIPIGQITEGLASCQGAQRRFQRKGYVRGALLIDDYAHHPNEIKTTLENARMLCEKEIYIIFQPHTYTRTKALLDEFAAVFSTDVNVVITDIYAAREPDLGLVHAKDLVDLIPGAVYRKTFQECAQYIEAHVEKGDMVITMGAGNVDKIFEQ